MDEQSAPQPVAGWFKLAALASIAFMAFGCVSYLMQVTADREKLPIDQRAMLDAAPTWMWAAFAIAVWIGLAGAIALYMRKRVAVRLLAISLIAVLVQFSSYLIVEQLRDLMALDGFAIPVVIVVLTWTVFWFAWHSQKKGWLV